MELLLPVDGNGEERSFRAIMCDDCNGTGKDAPHTDRWCDTCAGTGAVEWDQDKESARAAIRRATESK
jgi:DnaJ-class molecular chaperone